MFKRTLFALALSALVAGQASADNNTPQAPSPSRGGSGTSSGSTSLTGSLPPFATPPLINLGIGNAPVGFGQQTNAKSLPVALSTEQIGSPSDAPWNGVGNPTLFSLWKAVYFQAAAVGTPGSAPPNGTQVPWFTPVPSATEQPVKFLTAPNVVPSTTENHLGEVGGNSTVQPAVLVRPANTTAYAIGQVIANSTTATAVTPLSFAVARKAAGTGRITRARLSSNNAGAAGASFRLHLFKLSPTTTAGDGAAIAGAVNGITAIKIGQFDFTLDAPAWSDGAKGIAAPAVGAYITFDCAAGSQAVYGLLEARSAYTPTSGETLTVAIEADRD